MSNRKWTPEENALLRERYGKRLRPSDAAALFGRTLNAVHMHAIHLGLRIEPKRATAWQLIQEVCKDGRPRTFSELAKAIGVTCEGVGHALRTARAKGLAHIASYEKVRGRWRAHWLPVPGTDAEAPPLCAEYERHRRYSVRRTAARRAERAACESAQQIAPAPRRIGGEQHELVRALFGMGAQS